MQDQTELFLNRLRRLQEKALLTQSEALKKIQLSKAMLSLIRNKVHPPSVKVLRRLAQAEIEAGIAKPITGETAVGDLAVAEAATGQPAADFFRPDYRKKRIGQLRDQIRNDREMIALLEGSLRQAEQELKYLESL